MFGLFVYRVQTINKQSYECHFPGVSKLSLYEPYPNPYKVAWLDKTTLPLTKRYLAPLPFATYSDKIWYNVMPMDITHILLGRSQLYDLDVVHYGKTNTYVFMHGGEKIKLGPSKPKEVKVSTNRGAISDMKQEKPLHVYEY